MRLEALCVHCDELPSPVEPDRKARLALPERAVRLPGMALGTDFSMDDDPCEP